MGPVSVVDTISSFPSRSSSAYPRFPAPTPGIPRGRCTDAARGVAGGKSEWMQRIPMAETVGDYVLQRLREWDVITFTHQPSVTTFTPTSLPTHATGLPVSRTIRT